MLSAIRDYNITRSHSQSLCGRAAKGFEAEIRALITRFRHQAQPVVLCPVPLGAYKKAH